MIGYQRGFLPFLWTTLALCLATGLLLVPGALELRLEWDAPLQLPEGYRVGVAAAHAFCAFAVLMLIGSLYAIHMRMGWRRRQNLITGFATVGTFGVLVLSGLGIYYVAAERASMWISVSHMGVGAATVITVAVHAMKGRKLRGVEPAIKP